jgi:hypothetical protein
MHLQTADPPRATVTAATLKRVAVLEALTSDSDCSAIAAMIFGNAQLPAQYISILTHPAFEGAL